MNTSIVKPWQLPPIAFASKYNDENPYLKSLQHEMEGDATINGPTEANTVQNMTNLRITSSLINPNNQSFAVFGTMMHEIMIMDISLLRDSTVEEGQQLRQNAYILPNTHKRPIHSVILVNHSEDSTENLLITASSEQINLWNWSHITQCMNTLSSDEKHIPVPLKSISSSSDSGLQRSEHDITAIAWSSKNSTLWVTTIGGALCAWDISTGHRIRTIQCTSDASVALLCITVLENGMVVAGGNDGILYKYDPAKDIVSSTIAPSKNSKYQQTMGDLSNKSLLKTRSSIRTIAPEYHGNIVYTGDMNGCLCAIHVPTERILDVAHMPHISVDDNNNSRKEIGLHRLHVQYLGSIVAADSRGGVQYWEFDGVRLRSLGRASGTLTTTRSITSLTITNARDAVGGLPETVVLLAGNASFLELYLGPQSVCSRLELGCNER